MRKPRIARNVFLVLLVAWLAFAGLMYYEMRKPPAQFTAFMAKPPMIVMIRAPFETMWNGARAGVLDEFYIVYILEAHAERPHSRPDLTTSRTPPRRRTLAGRIGCTCWTAMAALSSRPRPGRSASNLRADCQLAQNGGG
jgi:hypothetical protein